MKSLERIEEIKARFLKEGEAGWEIEFLLRSFEVMREIALEHCTDLNLYKKYFLSVDELFESRMSTSEKTPEKL